MGSEELTELLRIHEGEDTATIQECRHRDDGWCLDCAADVVHGFMDLRHDGWEGDVVSEVEDDAS